MEIWQVLVQGTVIFGMVTVFVRFVAFPEDADAFGPRAVFTLKSFGKLCVWFVGGGMTTTVALLALGALVSRLA